jgi:enoyl-CoA hydratase/carnithine racemase
MGLVAEVVPAATVRARGLALAQRIAERAPLAVRATLASARTAREHGRDRAAAELMGHARPLFASADAREGILSFIERRDGRFTGR